MIGSTKSDDCSIITFITTFIIKYRDEMKWQWAGHIARRTDGR